MTGVMKRSPDSVGALVEALEGVVPNQVTHQIFYCRTGLARRGDEGTRIVTQYPQPGGYISGVIQPRRVGNLEIGTEKRGAELSHQLLHGVRFITEPLGEIPFQAGIVPAPMC